MGWTSCRPPPSKCPCLMEAESIVNEDSSTNCHLSSCLQKFAWDGATPLAAVVRARPLFCRRERDFVHEYPRPLHTSAGKHHSISAAEVELRLATAARHHHKSSSPYLFASTASTCLPSPSAQWHVAMSLCPGLPSAPPCPQAPQCRQRRVYLIARCDATNILCG